MIPVKKWSGRKIGMPGVYAGIPLETYHAADICVEPSISSSGLRTIFSKSEKHYWCTSPLNPKRIEPEESEAFIFGRAAHHRLLGEADFKKLFVIRPETLGGEKWHGQRTACKLWLKDHRDKGYTVITPAQIETIDAMRASLIEEPLIQAGILNGDIERSWFWKDEKTGIWLKWRPDASPNDSLDFADLKSTTSVDYEDLQYAIRDYGYYQQAGLGAELCQRILNKPMNSFSLVFVEKKPPHCVQIVTLKEDDIARGMKANRIALDRFAKALASNVWPGPGGGQTDARYIGLREHDAKKIDRMLSVEQPTEQT